MCMYYSRGCGPYMRKYVACYSGKNILWAILSKNFKSGKMIDNLSGGFWAGPAQSKVVKNTNFYLWTWGEVKSD